MITKEELERARKEGIKEAAADFAKWFEARTWDINGGAYIIPKIVMKTKLAELKELEVK